MTPASTSSGWQTFARKLGERMRELGLHAAQLTSTFIENLYQTASLHDIGKVARQTPYCASPES